MITYFKIPIGEYFLFVMLDDVFDTVHTIDHTGVRQSFKHQAHKYCIGLFTPLGCLPSTKEEFEARLKEVTV